LLLALTGSPALAQNGGMVIVVPGRPDVPVLMNGVDVSWAVIEGEFGLSRPGLVNPIVIYRPWLVAVSAYGPAASGPRFFPSTGKQPGYGRLEIEPSPDRPLPPPAQSYRKSWSSQSAPGPATDYAPFPPPPIDLSIGGGSGRRDHDRHDHDEHEGDHGHGHK
jgi:hypothetical protein